MSSSVNAAVAEIVSDRPARAGLPWGFYTIEGLTSAGTSLLITAIFFYTKHQYHWQLRDNFMLACGQGVFYVAGALTAGPLTRRVSRQAALSGTYAAMGLLAMIAWATATHPVIVTLLLLCYSFCSTVSWPIIESLVSTAGPAGGLSQRVSFYNIVWALVSVAMLAVAGSLIELWPAGVFLIPLAVHVIGAVVMFAWAKAHAKAASDNDASGAPVHASVEVEPALKRVRVLALWLSRVALPSTYVVVFSLLALMPSLPILKGHGPAFQTAVGAIWMGSRLVAFILLSIGTWWHTRPQLLLISAIVMLVAFLGVAVRLSDAFGTPEALDLPTMIVAQIVLGFVLGMIYAGSLYFGMALSEGSTDHGGYHEALIGVGFILGPGAGALAQSLYPGYFYAGVRAVSVVVLFSVAATIATAIAARNKKLETRN